MIAHAEDTPGSFPAMTGPEARSGNGPCMMATLVSPDVRPRMCQREDRDDGGRFAKGATTNPDVVRRDGTTPASSRPPSAWAPPSRCWYRPAAPWTPPTCLRRRPGASPMQRLVG